MQNKTNLNKFLFNKDEVLRGLHLQMQHNDYKYIIEILENSQSIFVKQLEDLYREVSEEIKKCNDNINYLQLLVEPCQDLNMVDSPDDVPLKLRKIIHLIRIIWLHSTYFNERECITTLLRALSNQIIIFCQKKINVTAILAGRPREGIEIANSTINCCIAYRLIYYDVRQHHLNRDNKFGWKLEETAIFNHVDAFVQRLNDLIEICNAMIVFGRCDETVKIPSPLFGGTRGVEFENACKNIENRFKKGLIEVQNVASKILDVHDSEWYDSLANYKLLTRDLEEIVENLISNVFISISNVEEGIETLCSLYYFSARPNLRSAYIQKTSEVWGLLAHEIDVTSKTLMESVNTRASWMPQYAGRAIMLKINLERIERLKNLFEKAEWLVDSTESIKTIAAYVQMKTNITKNIKQLNDQWLDTIDTNVITRLDRTLMCRSVTRPGLLECNIDRRILELCEEARYFEMMGFGVPVHISQIYTKYNTIRLVYESVLRVVLDYNKILGSLSDKERVLFKALIQNCERRIMPGIYKLTWGGELIDAYIAECVKQTGLLQEFVDIYKKANMSIVQTCEKICDTPIIEIVVPTATPLEVLKGIIEKFRKKKTLELLNLYNGIIDMIVIVYDGFEAQMDNMAEEWVEYIRKFDNLIQEALRACVKNSMNMFFSVLHGDGTMGPSPILQIDIDLKDNKINFSPAMKEVAEFLGSIPYMVISSLKRFPRLFEKFHLPTSDELGQYSQVIQDDEEFDRLVHTVQEEIIHNQTQINEYVDVWAPFKSVWDVDKASFLERYKESKASEFDVNITIYTETANQVQLQETVSSVYLVDINSSNLKKSILMHIEEWKDRYKELLKKNAYEKITNLYDYTRNNAKSVLTIPTTIQQMQESIALYDKLMNDRPAKESEFPTIKHFFLIIDKYEVTISSSIRQMNVNLEEQWNWFLARLKEAEEMLDNSKDGFKLNLLEESEQLKDAAKNLLNEFKTLPTSPATSPKDALQALRLMREQLQVLYDQETRMLNDLAVFNINIPDNQDLRNLEKELNALEEAWDLADQWEEAWLLYKTGNFWDIKTDEMEDLATVLFRRLNRLSKQLNDKNWDIINTTKIKVDEFRKTLPLLVALKNPALRTRHWDRVRNVVVV